MSASSSKIQNTKTGVSGQSVVAHEQTVRRRRSKLSLEKKIADDEFMAASVGDVEWLKQSLKDAGSGINFDKNGLAAIHLAAIHGHLDCLKTCIEKFKTDINLPSTTGWRAVHLCINNHTGQRSLQCLTYLIEQGADCSVTNDDGFTPAHQAASEGHVQCLKLLLAVNAKFDGKDGRGNTPLDLAKLWGHRKCARILAAGMWREDKDYIAKEMQLLKKVKMQQVLKELEAEERKKEIRQFYGDRAFKQWNANTNLAEKPCDQVGVQNMESKKESLFKPNSISRVNNGIEPHETIKMKIPENVKNQPNKLIDKVPDNKIGDKLYTEKSKLDRSVKWKKNTIHNKAYWNISTKNTNSQYVPNLDDDFPRDEYTLMPQVKGAPKFFEGKFVHPLTPDSIDEDIKKMGLRAKLRKPDLPEEIINSVLSKDSSASDRGMIFKCKHVEDIHMKKKFDIDKIGRSEAALHLTNDISSFLVINSLRVRYTVPKAFISKSDISSNSDFTDDLSLNGYAVTEKHC